ncbi:MAG: hypothetical protein PHC69_05670 [Ruminiclostridium sp.]|nr:hypothetical protein [Ruminiclostridium sp.]
MLQWWVQSPTGGADIGFSVLNQKTVLKKGVLKMLVCNKCKKYYQDGDKFCLLCGSPLEKASDYYVDEPQENQSSMQESGIPKTSTNTLTNTSNYYETRKKPKKGRARRFITVISMILVIAIISMSVVNYFFEPAFISKLSKGALFGFHTSQITEKELKEPQNFTWPSDKEIADYSNFARKLSNRFYLSFNNEEKEDFNEIKEGAKKVTAHLRKIESAQNSIRNNFAVDLPEQIDTYSYNDTTPFSYNEPIPLLSLNLTSVVLSSSISSSFEKESNNEKEEDIYDPEVLNEISASLYVNGYPELASAVASMIAADFPEDPISALNFATILREANADEDAFNVLQYALRLSPNSEPILYSLGMCALDLRNTSYAETCFMKILSLNGSSGPGHQGMMLCYMDSKNYSSAFLHMLEGAREGYTTMVTETYKVLREKNDEYIDIAKPIFEQYSMEQLLDFTKSRTAFDDTLDIPAGQLEISKDIKLGTESVGVYSSSSEALNQGLQYAMSAYSHAKITFDDAYSMIMGMGGSGNEDGEATLDGLAGEFSKSILEKVFSSAANGSTVSADGWLGISYEQEVFWINILDDYIQVKLEDYLEEYFEKPYEEAFKNPDSVIPSLMKHNETIMQLCESNPIQVGATALGNLINNNSVYDTGVQKANKKDMDKFLQNVNPKLEEGYKKTADLMETYWLHYGSLLGQIGNDETYNRYQQSRKTNVASALTPYIVGGTINCFLVTMNFIAVDSDNTGSGGQITFPDFPDFPDSQMGEAYTPPPQRPNNDQGLNPQDEEPAQEETKPTQQGETTAPGEDSSQTGEAEPPKPGHGNSGTSDITTEDSGTISAGPFSMTVSDSGWELDLTAIGSVNLRYDKKTGSISLFGGVGVSLGLATSGGSVKSGVYATFNPQTKDITSGRRSAFDLQIAGNGFGVEKQTCFATGADTTTVSAILLHKKSSQTIINN